MKNRRAVPAFGGLAVAWGGTVLLLSPAGRLLGPPDRPGTNLLQLLVLWMLFGLVVLITTRWEKQSLESIGLRRFRWPSLAWGLGLAGVTIGVVMPLLASALQVAGIDGFERGMARILTLPIWYRVVAVVTAGIVEDTLFLGYSFTRLSVLTGSQWLAGILTGAGFCFLHLSYWGIGPVLVYFATVGVAWAFFAWRRDLLANIVAHTTVNGIALVVVPILTANR